MERTPTTASVGVGRAYVNRDAVTGGVPRCDVIGLHPGSQPRVGRWPWLDLLAGLSWLDGHPRDEVYVFWGDGESLFSSVGGDESEFVD